jgi:hypothetical protein
VLCYAMLCYIYIYIYVINSWVIYFSNKGESITPFPNAGEFWCVHFWMVHLGKQNSNSLRKLNRSEQFSGDLRFTWNEGSPRTMIGWIILILSHAHPWLGWFGVPPWRRTPPFWWCSEVNCLPSLGPCESLHWNTVHVRYYPSGCLT